MYNIWWLFYFILETGVDQSAVLQSTLPSYPSRMNTKKSHWSEHLTRLKISMIPYNYCISHIFALNTPNQYQEHTVSSPIMWYVSPQTWSRPCDLLSWLESSLENNSNGVHFSFCCIASISTEPANLFTINCRLQFEALYDTWSLCRSKTWWVSWYFQSWLNIREFLTRNSSVGIGLRQLRRQILRAFKHIWVYSVLCLSSVQSSLALNNYLFFYIYCNVAPFFTCLK